MTDFEENVISLLKVIANGQMVMLGAMPKMTGTSDLVAGQQELVSLVFQKIDAMRAFEREQQQSEGQVGD